MHCRQGLLAGNRELGEWRRVLHQWAVRSLRTSRWSLANTVVFLPTALRRRPLTHFCFQGTTDHFFSRSAKVAMQMQPAPSGRACSPSCLKASGGQQSYKGYASNTILLHTILALHGCINNGKTLDFDQGVVLEKTSNFE